MRDKWKAKRNREGEEWFGPMVPITMGSGRMIKPQEAES
jgi:hypothetical protein